jgi:hypothetical protein
MATGSVRTLTAVCAPEVRTDRAPASRPRRGVRSTATGAQFDSLLDFETWSELGTRLGVYTSATSWWLGDWIAFGRMKYGRRYKEAVVATGLDYQTLRNYAVVARRFEISRRRANLTFQHHAVLCALSDDQQETWLDRAEAGRWSRNELRRRLRAAGSAGPPADEIFRLAVARAQAHLWREAAERSRCRCEAWIVGVLDDAAAALLADEGRAA